MRIAGAAALVGLWLTAMALPLVVVAAGRDAQATQAVDGESFGGAWSATGTRQTLPTEGGGTAAVVHITGAIVLTEGAAVGAGFRGEAIGFDNGNIAAGRAVWTDARGDQVFSTLTGEPIRTGRRIVGTITGGTGRFAGVSGAYEMTWQYVVSGEGDAIQGRSADLRGRLRRNGGR